MRFQRRHWDGVDTVQDHTRENSICPIGLLGQSGHKAANRCRHGGTPPDRNGQWLDPAKEIPGLFGNPSWHITEMSSQHIGNSRNLAHYPRNGTGRHSKMDMEHIWLPSSDFTYQGRDRRDHPECHLGNTAGIFTSSKGTQAPHLHALLHGLSR